jgi:hypothetical protein
MRSLIDECLHQSLVEVAHAAGFEAMHVNHLYAGLIVLVPNAVPGVQRALFEAAIRYLAGRDLVNTVIEVTLESKVVRCVEYQLPAR